MTRWQRHARLALAVVAGLTILAVVLTVRGRESGRAGGGVERLDPTAVAESSGGRMTQATGTRIPGYVESEHTLTYADGSMKLIKPRVTSTRAGREFLLTGNEAQVGAGQTHYTMQGDVQLAASDGLAASTAEASYSEGEAIVRAPGPVQFSRGRLKGSGVGMTFDQGRDVIWLLDQAVIDVAAGRGEDAGAHIVAGAAGLARRDRYMRFERGVTLTRGPRTIAADGALAYLAEDEDRLRALELRGNSRITMHDAAEGGLRTMDAADMNLAYGEDGESLERAVLVGKAVVQFAGSGGAAGRRLSADALDITLGPAGEVLALTARNHVQLAFPAEPGAPARVIGASAMDGTGAPGAGLTSARFSDPVEYRETPATGPARVARARALRVALAPGTGAIDEALFTGQARFEEEKLRASGAEARYLVGQGVLELSGVEAGRVPRVEDERLAVDAKEIRLALEGRKMTAKGEVQSVLQPAPRGADKGQKGAGATPGDAPTVPGLLKDDQPVNITGAALDYDGGAARAVYTGGSRLWQGATTVQGETITVDERTGDLLAGGGVRSAMTMLQKDSKTGETREVPTIASGADLHYEDALRRATYTTKAHVNGPQGDLHAHRIELYLAEEGGSLDRAEGYEDVRLTADARTATGARMTFFAADERYVMSGAPVRIVEECRETTGKTLTFFRSTDRILVDGNEQRRTLAKKSGPCPEPPPK